MKLTALQKEVLFHSYRGQSATVTLSDIAKAVGRSKSGVLKVLDSLILKRLVSCDEEGWKIYLTQDGVKVRNTVRGL